jgi:uncharacterized protein YciI
MSEYLYRLTPTRAGMLSDGPTEHEARVVDSHFRYLQELASDGPVALAGRTLNSDASSFGIVIIEADEPTARSIMTNDPAVREGVMSAQLFPFRTALRGGD